LEQEAGLSGEGGGRGFFHQPVMLEEVLASLKPKPGGIYVDCTVGGGGHSREVLRLTAPGGCLIGLDRDPYALEHARQYLADYRQRATLVKENFIRLPQVLKELGITAVDGILYDLGVSSAQLETAQRGFSYMTDGPLDMRMDPEEPVTARQLVNNLPEAELANLIWRYGEERWAKRIAAFIVREREYGSIETTGHLVNVIKQAIPARGRRQGPHPAKRTFQALRIAVNRELDVLAQALKEAVAFLKPEGRLCVITFHSLEDRIVKESFRKMAASCTCPPDFPVCVCSSRARLRLVAPHFLTPPAMEVERNPRSRSARLRVAEKVD